MTNRDDDALRARVERLERDVPPARDLWPDVARRIEARRPRRASAAAQRARVIGASALALAAVVALVVARDRRSPPPSSLLVASASAPSRAGDPSYQPSPVTSLPGEGW
jgi:hypothetical protein